MTARVIGYVDDTGAHRYPPPPAAPAPTRAERARRVLDAAALALCAARLAVGAWRAHWRRTTT